MPKTKEQKRKEANDRVLIHGLRTMVRQIYNHCPGNYMDKLLNEPEQPLFWRFKLSLLQVRDSFYVNAKLKDYAFSVDNVAVFGYLNAETLATLFLSERMIEWVDEHCIDLREQVKELRKHRQVFLGQFLDAMKSSPHLS